MTGRALIGLLAGALSSLPALEQPASARSVAASSGAVFSFEDLELEDCLTFDFETGAMISSCVTAVSVPLPVDRSGSKTLTFSGRNPEPDWGEILAGGGVCWAVGSDRFGTSISVSPSEHIPFGETVDFGTTDAVAVPSKGVFVATCVIHAGIELYELDYAP